MSTEGIISILATGDHQQHIYGPRGILATRGARGGTESEFIARYQLFQEALEIVVSECPAMACWLKLKNERDATVNVLEQLIANNDSVEEIKRGIQDEMSSGVAQEAMDNLLLYLFPASVATAQPASAHSYRQNNLFSRTTQKLRGFMASRQI